VSSQCAFTVSSSNCNIWSKDAFHISRFYAYSPGPFTQILIHAIGEFTAAVLTISGPKREEEAVSCRRLHNEELHNLYASPRTISLMKSRRMKWAGM
jgi:hypothetical protein